MPNQYQLASRRPTPGKRSEQTIIRWQDPPVDLFSDTRTDYLIGGHDLRPSKENRFVGEWNAEASKRSSWRDSHGIQPPPQAIGQDSSDIFLFGHSTTREYGVPKRGGPRGFQQQTRGVAVAPGAYVGPSKVAAYLDAATPQRKDADNPVRIWLYSCETAADDLEREGAAPYAPTFARKLAGRGWRNVQIISFKETVWVGDILHARQLAESTPLDRPIKFSGRLKSRKPRIWFINDEGEITKDQGYKWFPRN